MRITKILTRLLAAGLALAALTSQAAPNAGVDYDNLPKVMPTEAPGKIEVIEFFWYGCPHCFHAEPLVEAWAKTLPADVVFRREHAMFEGQTDWEAHAKLFAALKVMGLVDRLTPAVFDAVHKDNIELRNTNVLFDWIAKQGVNRAQFMAAYNSPAAQNELTHTIQISNQYGLTGVPAFIINGKYRTSPSKAKSAENMFKIINELVAQERAALKPAATPVVKPEVAPAKTKPAKVKKPA